MIRYNSSAQFSLEGFAPFCDKLDENNRWVKLGRSLPWDRMAAVYHRALSVGKGRPALDARKVIGAMIIKHKMKTSDEATVEMISENVFQQWFCGMSAFTTEKIFDPSLFVTLRKRMGGAAYEAMNQAILDLAEGRTGAKEEPTPQDPAGQEEDQDPPPPENKGELKIDATVAPQKIAYPTDLGLLNEAREITEGLIDALWEGDKSVTKPRTYRRNARKDFLLMIKKRKRTKKELRKAIGKQLRYLGRNLRTIDRLWSAVPWPLDHRALQRFWVVQEVYRQQLHMHTQRVHRVDDRIVSISQPHVRPMVRGKAAANVEFGAKLNVALHDGVAWLDHLGWDAHNESEWLIHQVEQYKQRYGHYPEAVNVDGIYGTRQNRAWLKERGIRFVGKALGRPSAESLTPKAKRALRKQMAQRNHVEGKFGQAKNAYGLGSIAAKRRDTSESWIHAILLVINIFTLLPKLHERSGFFIGFLLRMVRNVMEGITVCLPVAQPRVDHTMSCRSFTGPIAKHHLAA
jgi:transposase, IS5 family